MRKYIVFIFLMLAVAVAMAQPIPDSVTCIPNSQLRKAIKAYETLKIARLELSVLKINHDTLLARLVIKDSIISNQGNELEVSEAMIKNLLDQKSEQQKKININQSLALHYQNKYVKQRGLTWTIGGVSVGVILIALLVK